MASTASKSNRSPGEKQHRRKRSEGRAKATRQDAYSLLKTEITRLARKEFRAEAAALKKASAQYRREIAAMKREIQQLKSQLRKRAGSVLSASTGTKSAAEHEESAHSGLRFSASRLAGHRQKIGLSAADYGLLAGVAGQTIYKWESGRARPRRSQLAGLAAVRGMGRREADRRLLVLKAAT